MPFAEKERNQSWIRRQLSRQMNRDYDFDDADYPTAVAAAAYAIQSIEKSKSRHRNETAYGPGKSSNKIRSKAEDIGIQPELHKSALKFSDKHLNISDSKSPETPSPKPDRQPVGWATTQPIETRSQSATKPGPEDSMADAWEKEEMASIKERYERLRTTIDNWEIKKKKKADQKLERTEGKSEKKRAKAAQRRRQVIKRIEEIAGGARAQAEENRRNEELKVKEKANKIRTTGKLPATCLCF
ncbi:hypothetical protein DH2020_032464 [Rehmannia glutinosa]|uniref:Remorin C-terminal domain-containing protein n=1 Tax=Rehmannia glutinosa TaxID=99300 RepID=A0ABR0VF45_REHGL